MRELKSNLKLVWDSSNSDAANKLGETEKFQFHYRIVLEVNGQLGAQEFPTLEEAQKQWELFLSSEIAIKKMALLKVMQEVLDEFRVD